VRTAQRVNESNEIQGKCLLFYGLFSCRHTVKLVHTLLNTRFVFFQRIRTLIDEAEADLLPIQDTAAEALLRSPAIMKCR
jgi:hypothetical protein